MSYINFESARVREELRKEKRKAREAVWEKADANYKRRKEREQRAKERGEDKWMLPSLDAQLQPDAHNSKKKHNKEKKKKKEKKPKKKKTHDSSESSDSSEGDEWVEKDASSQPASNTGPTQRDEWMTLPALFPCVSRDQIRAQKRADMPQDEEALKKKFLLDNPGQSEKELNPFWKDGGKGLPQVEEPLPDSLSLAANTAGDHGVAWLRRALRRVQEQASEQGRSEEAVAAERWGSLEKLKGMLLEAERRCRSRPRDGGRGRRGGRMQGPAPKPREYEDWSADPTATAESETAQSEVVGDKSRYRSWLGIKDPSPQPESSSEEDDFDYDKLDDPPVVEEVEIKEKKTKGKEKNLPSEKDISDEDNDGETDGKILFRSTKARKENLSCIQSKLQAAKNKLNAFGKKVPEQSAAGKCEENESDDDEKLFEEWRNERKAKGSDDSDDESGKEKDLKGVERCADKRGSEQKEKHIRREERSERDLRKVHPLSSDDLRERFFQTRNKGGLLKDVREKDKEDVKEIRRGSDSKEERIYSNVREEQKRKDDSLSENKYRVDDYREKRKNWNEETKPRNEKSNDKYGNSGLRRDERELDRRKSDKERIDSSSRDRKRDESDREERRRYDERGRPRGNSSERYIQRKEGSDYLSNRDRDDYKDSKIGRRGDSNESFHRSRDRQAGSRRTEIPNYLQKQDISPMQYERAPPRRLEGFQKPEEELHAPSKSGRHDILGDTGVIQASSGTKNWRKKEFCKPEEKMVKKESTPSSNFTSKPLPTIQPTQVKEKEEQKEKLPEVQMSDAEMNALGAKVLKAELLGNHALAAKLKAQLEQAQIARKQRANAPRPAASTSKTQEEETVILTHRDSKGFVRPLEAPSHVEPSGGRRKPQKVATHGTDGLRERYFPDDDKYTLDNMFQKEKMTTMEDTNEEFYRLVSKDAGRANSEYDLDDIFADKISREIAPGKLQVLERNRAIQHHKRVERSLDSCTRCFDSPKMLKHLMVALGSKVYLSLPAHQSLTEGHCLLAPIHHVPCATQLDEDVWDEMSAFRKALVSMFSEQEQDCVFFESSMHLQRFPHMVLECVPLPREVGDTAPIYFKKAIMESEAEWSMNKKLVDLKGKGVRRAVPKGLPYFAVDFGNDDGFAHVIEDEKLFPENFAQEIVGGMLDLHHSLWRKPRFEKFDAQYKKVVEFAKMWKKFDVTKRTEEDSSDSSSDSDKE